MKVLVHLHIYYLSQVDYYLHLLKNIKGCEYDLYVTIVENDKNVISKIKKQIPTAKIIKVCNYGYDVGAFIKVLNLINLDNYDLVLKLHTKGYRDISYQIKGIKFKGFEWRNSLVNPLLKNVKTFKKILDLFEQNDKVGMYGNKNLLFTNKDETAKVAYLDDCFEKAGINIKNYKFIAGTMFVIRANILKPLQQMNLSINDFKGLSHTNGMGSLAHAVERVFGVLVLNQNYKIKCSESLSISQKITRITKAIYSKRIYQNKKIFNFLGLKITINKKRLRVLIVSHDLSQTGAPLSAVLAAKILNKKKYYIEFYSLYERGPLGSELENNKIKFTILNNDNLTEKEIKNISNNFDVVICNTIVTYRIYEQLKNILPIIWWIRESVVVDEYLRIFPDLQNILKNAKNIYVMSDYSKQYLRKHTNNISIIKHGMDDEFRVLNFNNSKMTFMMVIGYICKEKGLEVLLNSIDLMSPELRAQSKFIIVLPKDVLQENHDVSLKLEMFPEVCIVDKITDRSKLISYYENSSVIVVPSLSEPVSRVAIEAMMMGKPVVLTENVGAKYLVNQDKNGLIVKADDANDLCRALETMLKKSPIKLKNMGIKAREAYLKNNSILRYQRDLIWSIKKVYYIFKIKNCIKEINCRLLFKLKNFLQKGKSYFAPKSKTEYVTPQDIIIGYRGMYQPCGYEIYRDNNLINIKGNNLYITGIADNTIWTGCDVLCKEEYNFSLNEPHIMFDIGFNLGFTSLYFAKYDNIKKIYGYESFKPTFDLGKNNIEQNFCYSKKIELFNYGLSDDDKTLEIKYNPDLPGAMSSVKNIFEDALQVEVIQIKNVSTIFEPIMAKHKEKVFLKIDCEGAEKEIIPALDKSGLLQKISVLIMEWHFESPQYLIDILEKNGFIVFCNHSTPNKLGMIRAFKK